MAAGARRDRSRAFARSGLTVSKWRAARQFGNRSALWSSVTPNLFSAGEVSVFATVSRAGYHVVCVAVSSSVVYAATSSGPGRSAGIGWLAAAARAARRRRPARVGCNGEPTPAGRRGRRGVAALAAEARARAARRGAAARAHFRAELVRAERALQTHAFLRGSRCVHAVN